MYMSWGGGGERGGGEGGRGVSASHLGYYQHPEMEGKVGIFPRKGGSVWWVFRALEPGGGLVGGVWIELNWIERYYR